MCDIDLNYEVGLDSYSDKVISVKTLGLYSLTNYNHSA